MRSLNYLDGAVIRFISRLKGRDSVSEARCELGLQTLQERRKNHWLILLTRILQAEDTHSALSSEYEELVDDHIVSYHDHKICSPW